MIGVHVADDHRVELRWVVAEQQLGDDAGADVDEDTGAAALDEVAGARLARVGRAGDRPRTVSRIGASCPCPVAWGRRYIAWWPCDSAVNPMAAKNGTAAGVLTSATSLRRRSGRAPRESGQFRRRAAGDPGGRSRPRDWHAGRRHPGAEPRQPAGRHDREPRATCRLPRSPPAATPRVPATRPTRTRRSHRQR